MLQSFPKYVLDDIIEILYNIVNGNVKISKKSHDILRRRKGILLSITGAKSPKARRDLVYKQNGGFLGMVLPIITGLLASL